MFNIIINRSHRSLSRIELSDEQIKGQAPSVFAAAPQAGVSERYTFLPTAQIISRMRQEGWAPVEVQQQAVRLEGRMGFQKHVIRFQRRDEIAKPGEFTPEIALAEELGSTLCIIHFIVGRTRRSPPRRGETFANRT